MTSNEPQCDCVRKEPPEPAGSVGGEWARRLRFAAIDIGSNSVRLEVAEWTSPGCYRVLAEDRANTRLGASLAGTCLLDELAVEMTIVALQQFVATARRFQVSQVRAIATSAVREAANRTEFCQAVQRRVGLDVEIVSAEKEAELAFLSVDRAYRVSGRNVAVMDVGGGSTEVVIAAQGKVQQVICTPYGAVRLTEKFRRPSQSRADLPEDLPVETIRGDIDLVQLERWIEGEIQATFCSPTTPVDTVYGSGGTLTALAAIHCKRVDTDHETSSLAGYTLTRSDVGHLFRELAKLPLGERAQVPGLAADRVEIIPAGLLIVSTLMQALQAEQLVVHTGGVRDGLMHEMFR